MSKPKSFQLVIPAMIVFFLLLPFVVQSKINSSKEKRPDILSIELGPQLSKKEMPGVTFLHDLHTRSLDDKCGACHMENENGLLFLFKRTDQQPSMELYHDECMACHVEKKGEGKPSGPMTDQCGACHVREPARASSWKKIKFDKSLHLIHISSAKIKSRQTGDEDNCNVCHHQYDAQKKELIYKKGEEVSCSYCHRPAKTDTVRTIRQASHDACVACHQEMKAKKESAGPISCAGCHDAQEQAKLEKVDPIPRLKRNQPDQLLLTPWEKGLEKQGPFMPAIAFDHKSHEEGTQSCKSCHHETLKKCSECHTPTGSEEKGGFVSLTQAMHQVDNARSCKGCHRELAMASECAGCHTRMPATSKDPESCNACHNVQPEEYQTTEDFSLLAKEVTAARSGQYNRVLADKIPETVVIKDLVKEYKASEFPHGKVVKALLKKAENSSLAKAFHKDETTLCMGCHHNSPKSLEPPKCGSCHSKNGPDLDGRPGLKGAFHGQCITCHQEMKVTQVLATDCVKCHEAIK